MTTFLAFTTGLLLGVIVTVGLLVLGVVYANRKCDQKLKKEGL